MLSKKILANNRLKIVFRADASIRTGTGHIMRCLALAGKLSEKGAMTYFICRESPGDLCSYLGKKGYRVFRILGNALKKKETKSPEDIDYPSAEWEKDALETADILDSLQKVDWLIVDNYGIDFRWEEKMRSHVEKIMVIDDLADRRHDCDILLDQNLYDNQEKRYNDLLPEGCLRLLGPGHTLLRQEFYEAGKKKRSRHGNVRRILVFFGGSDESNETAKALEAIRLIDRAEIIIDVVVGKNNPNKEAIEKQCMKSANINYYCQVDNMAELISRADLSIGAGGSSMWERCALGLPSIIITIAHNQVEASSVLARKGAAWYAGPSEDVEADGLALLLKEVIHNKDSLKMAEKRALELMGGVLNMDSTPLMRIILETGYAES